ncbi:MAG TPA: hypothetical protein VH143_20250 [Kofleriaceae bacterium]|jgi:hypothetical protein|nr:hypothetical protein [Kofleriaceae bacterium]
MARQRRGPELRGTLGTLLRTTLAQAGNLRDVLERGAREGRSRVEDVLATRRRTDALAELGEIVLDLIRRGEVDVDELPEARDIVQHLDELDAGSDDDDRDRPRQIRKRFDTRPSTDREADGTASSTTWAPPNRPRGKSAERVWRPNADAIPTPAIAKRSGGIRFEDNDDDLAEYMHPDDVPKKPDP